MADIIDTKEVYAEEYYFKQKQPKMGNGDMPLFSIEENDSISCYIKIEDEQSIIFQYSKGNCVLQSSNNVAIDRVFFTNTNSRVYFYVHSTKLIDLQYWTLYGTTVQDETVLQYHELANQNIEITGSGVFLAGDVVFNKAAFDLMEVRNTLTASDIINRYRHVDLPETLDPDDPNRNVYIKIPPFIGDYTIYMEDNDNDLMATIKFTRGINFNVEFPFASAVYSTQQLQYIKEIFADKFGNTYIATRAFGELYFSQTSYKEIVVPTTAQGTAPYLPEEEKLFSYIPEELNRMVIFGDESINFGLDIQGEMDAKIIKTPEVSTFPKVVITDILEVTGEVLYELEEPPLGEELDLVIVDKDTHKLYKLGATIDNTSVRINKIISCNSIIADGIGTKSISTDRITVNTAGENIVVENTTRFDSSVGITNILTANRDDALGSTLSIEVPTQFDGTVYVDGDLHVDNQLTVGMLTLDEILAAKQNKLIAGENIIIDQATNTISSTGGGGVGDIISSNDTVEDIVVYTQEEFDEAERTGTLTAGQLINIPDLVSADTTSVPIGAIIGSPLGTLPNYLLCNGQEASRTQYSMLFDKIGTMYGEGDGTTTFNVPDFRNMFLRGFGDITEPIGTEQAEGLPNIEGSVRTYGAAIYSAEGAFEKDTATDQTPSVTSSYSASNKAFFKANLSNPIYGASGHVTPVNQALNYFIKAREDVYTNDLVNLDTTVIEIENAYNNLSENATTEYLRKVSTIKNPVIGNKYEYYKRVTNVTDGAIVYTFNVPLRMKSMEIVMRSNSGNTYMNYSNPGTGSFCLLRYREDTGILSIITSADDVSIADIFVEFYTNSDLEEF